MAQCQRVAPMSSLDGESKSLVPRNKGVKGTHHMSALEFVTNRKRNPYREPQDPSLVHRMFWNKFQ